MARAGTGIAAFRTEREVETNFVRPLFEDVLGYPTAGLHWNQPVKLTLGREKRTKAADLVVYHEDRPVVTVEAKKPTEPIGPAIGQVDSYAFALQTPYSVITNGRHFVLRGYYSFNSRINVIDDHVDALAKKKWSQLHSLISLDNIISSMTEPSEPVATPNEEKIRDYRRFFRRIHNEIRDRDRLDPAAAFDELSKLLFLKAAEDEWQKKRRGAQPVLTPDKIDEWEPLGAAEKMVNDWFQSATDEMFPDVFENNPRITLSMSTLKTVLGMMQPFHVRNGDVDVKGRAFEEFLPSQLRGKGLGQFFTPRPVVNFMVDLAGVSIQDVVLDFACGSGGFLIKAFEQMQQSIEQMPEGILNRLKLSRDDILDQVKERQIFGVDAEPRAARTAKMNMIMWGDGRKVVRGNALDDRDFRGKLYPVREYSPSKEGKNGNGCTLILANPPFGSKEKDRDVLKKYVLGSKLKHRKSEKTEILFLEKGLRLLRPEGRMLIVIPQGVMSGSTLAHVRDLIHSQSEIRAIISLPTHTFVQSGVPTVNTCILYVQKFTNEKRELYDQKTKGLSDEEVRTLIRTDPDFDYPIFMATSEFVGFDPGGRMIAKPGEETDLDLILQDYERQADVAAPDVDVFEFASRHYRDKSTRRRDQTVRGSKRGLKTSFTVKLSETEDRLDPPFYLFRYQAGPLLSDVPELGKRVKAAGKRFKPESEDELDAEYPILSVTSDGRVSLGEYKRGEALNPKYNYKRVSAGNIVYNPSRVNIGSIGVVPDRFDGAYVSPEYVVFGVEKFTPEFLLQLLRSPFYRMYIDIVSTGSIRDRLYFRDLKQIRIPDVGSPTQKQIIKSSHEIDRLISGLSHKAREGQDKIRDAMHSLVIDPKGKAAKRAIAKVANSDRDVSELFRALADQWNTDKPRGADVSDMVMHSAYQQIIGMGDAAVPYLLAELERKPSHWFWALHAITRNNPVAPDAEGDIGRMAEAWVRWGREQGYQW